MESKKKRQIRVVVAEKPFVLTIDVDEEERVRRAAKDINDKILQIRNGSKVDMQDALTMAAIQVSVTNQENIYKLEHSIDQLQIQQMNEQIDQFLD